MRQENEAIWAVRATAFQLLSIGLTCPDPDIAEGVRDGSIFSDVAETLDSLGFVDDNGRLASSVQELGVLAVDPDLLSILRREYTRLFTDPKKPLIDLYETLFLDPGRIANDLGPILIRSPEAVDARHRYEAAGAKMAVRDSPDNMRIECEFAGYLYHQLAESEREEDARGWLEHLEGFTNTHLRRWFAAFFDQMKAKAAHPYYRLMGVLGCQVADTGLT